MIEDVQEFRIARLMEASKKAGGDAALGRLMGYANGAYIGQLKNKWRPIKEDFVQKLESIPGYDGWFAAHPKEIDLENNPDYPTIRRVQFKLSAGASGFSVDYRGDLGPPIPFPKAWYERKGLTPSKLFATTVSNGSMEPGLFDGDTVVVNTAGNEPKDGRVFAVNYEGELVIKRLVRDDGQWWLSSDNPDQRRYPRKVCHEGVVLLGEIVHKQSERI